LWKHVDARIIDLFGPLVVRGGGSALQAVP
jgi:hypothetical protein